MSDCAVCCLFTKTSRQCKCGFCDFVACESCVKKYVLSLSGHAKCMSCSKPWSRQHLHNMFGAYFIDKHYKPRREELLFELEKALFPETHMWAVCQKNINRCIDEMKNIDSLSLNTRLEYGNLRNSMRASTLEERLEYFDEVLKTTKKIKNLEYAKDRLEVERMFWYEYRGGTGHHKSAHRASRTFKCSNADCKGFISGGKWNCDLCKTLTCNKCHETEGPDHVCDENTIATVELLMKDSKNCPKCATTIYKISGCSQMYCTSCHTAFEWGTLEIVTGIIHNPHYYEWIRKTGGIHREIGDIPCGGLPHIRNFYLYGSRIMSAHQLASHVEHVILPFYRPDGDLNRNRSLRVDYMIDKITLKEFKTELHKREKAQEKKREISTIMNTFLVVASDIFRKIMSDPKNMECEKELEAIRLFTNETLLENVSRVYKCVVPTINAKWIIENIKL